MTTISPNQCVACKHASLETLTRYGVTPTCAAYPNGIPLEIWAQAGDHREPRGDEKGGRVFTMSDRPAAETLFGFWESFTKALAR